MKQLDGSETPIIQTIKNRESNKKLAQILSGEKDKHIRKQRVKEEN